MPFLPTHAFPVDVLPNGHVRALAAVAWTGHHGDAVLVPAGYVSDWGSVPWLVRAVLPHDGPLCRAFLVHDVLCTALADYRRDLADWVPSPRWGPRPVPPSFDPVDTDAVLRLILAELGDAERAAGRRRPFGTGPARWLYWLGVRAGALGNPARRAGFCRARSLVPFLVLALPTLAALLPAALGALVSRALVAVGEAAAAPWEAAARDKRTAHTVRIRSGAAGCPLDGTACTADCEDWPACTELAHHTASVPPVHPAPHPDPEEWRPWIAHAPWPALDDDDPRSTR